MMLSSGFEYCEKDCAENRRKIVTQTDTPIETLAMSLHGACLRDLPEIHYRDRDWEAHRTKMNKMSREEKASLYQRERESGQVEGPFVEKTRRPTPYDCEVVMFPQSWGSTALGFGGVGGAAMTTAYTVIVECHRSGASAVYFGGRFAYLVESNRRNAAFREDVAKQSMADCATSPKRYKAEGER